MHSPTSTCTSRRATRGGGGVTATVSKSRDFCTLLAYKTCYYQMLVTHHHNQICGCRVELLRVPYLLLAFFSIAFNGPVLSAVQRPPMYSVSYLTK